MSDKKQKRNPKTVSNVPLSPEQEAAALAEKQAREAAAKLERERIQRYEKSLPKMSFRQLRGELRRNARKPNDGSPLTAGLASVLLTVLDNTKTRENPFGKLEAYPR
jgi:hypothetical protein